MRNILFLCLLASTFPGHAAMADKFPHHPNPEKQSLSVGKSKQHNRPFRQFLAKSIAKIAIASPGNSYGKGSAIAGLACAVALIASWFISPYLGYFLTIPLLVAGLTLSIVGLVRSKRYAQNRLAKSIAIAGIILNSLLIIFLFSLLAWAFG